MLSVGLTGGIGSGKSTVAAMLTRRGAVVVDADQLAREVVAPGTAGLREIVAAFGPDVLTATGELDRPAMGRRIFGDEAARRRLEAVIHPRVRARAGEIEQAAAPDAIVVHDIPLLVETGQGDRFDVVVVVDAPVELQRERLMRTRGLSQDEASARIAAQATRDQRRAAADHVIVNDATTQELAAAVDRVWEFLRSASGTRP